MQAIKYYYTRTSAEGKTRNTQMSVVQGSAGGGEGEGGAPDPNQMAQMFAGGNPTTVQIDGTTYPVYSLPMVSIALFPSVDDTRTTDRVR